MKSILNKNRKIAFIAFSFCSLFLLIGRGNAQCTSVDLQGNATGPSVTSIATSQSTPLYVEMKNNSIYGCAIPTGEATAQVTLSNVYFNIGNASTFSDPGGVWTYLGDYPVGANHVLYFSNNAGPMPAGSDYVFQIDIIGATITPSTLNAGNGALIQLNSSLSGTASTSDYMGSNQSATGYLAVTNPLPVKLISFNGNEKNCSSVLNWQSNNEVNFSRFEIEFSSNGRAFANIGTVNGKGLSGGVSDYTFSYPQPASIGYYRLKMVDIDGQFNYSNTIKIVNSCTMPKAAVYPNPVTAHNLVNVVLENFGTKVQGSLFDATGKLLEVVRLTNSTNKLSMQNYASGVYLLKVVDENENSSLIRIVVSR